MELGQKELVSQKNLQVLDQYNQLQMRKTEKNPKDPTVKDFTQAMKGYLIIT